MKKSIFLHTEAIWGIRYDEGWRMNVSLLDAQKKRSDRSVMGYFVVGHGANMARGAVCEREMYVDGDAAEWERGRDSLKTASFSYI